MKTQRTINLAWPLMVFIFALVVEETVWGLGAQLFENPATKMNDVHKIAGGDPVNGYVPVLGYCTSTATGTSAGTADRMCFKPIPDSLPPGAPGQVPTVSAITETGTVIATGTQTTITTGTATYTTTASQTAQIGTATIVVTFTQGATQTTTGTGTGTYSYSSTGTATTTGTEIKMTNGTVDFDPMGTFYLGSVGGEVTGELWTRRADLGWIYAGNTTSYSGTCSTGSDALLATFQDMSSLGAYGPGMAREVLGVVPGGQWMADVRAKVNANGAALRIEVWASHYLSTIDEAHAHLFNWTTGDFSNTDYAQITRQATMPEVTSLLLGGEWSLYFKVYATCSTSTTVTVEAARESNGYASRIYSPFTVEKVGAYNVYYYSQDYGLTVGAALWGLEQWSGGVDSTLTNKEDVISGTPGQFVKFIGTGTSATTSKGAATVGVTTRYFTVPASSFRAGSGSTIGTLGTDLSAWTFDDGQDDFAYGTTISIPADVAGLLYVAPIWSPSATDATTTHRVLWSFGKLTLATGASTAIDSFTGLNGALCGSACVADAVIKEARQAISSPTAGETWAIRFGRAGTSGTDTYVGNVRLIALEFSYTSSL